MLHDNLLHFRKMLRLSQEEMAGRIEVSRQTYAKWESGDTTPELKYCITLAQIFGITLDELIADRDLLVEGPPGKYVLGVVEPDAQGRIVLPEKAMRLFGICPGDKLLLLADKNEGMALVSYDIYAQFAKRILDTEAEENHG